MGFVSSIQILHSKNFENFYANPIMIRGVSCQDMNMSELRFKRRLSPSEATKASVITVPRAIAQAWEQYSMVEIAFDGERLVITPADEGKRIPGANSR